MEHSSKDQRGSTLKMRSLGGVFSKVGISMRSLSVKDEKSENENDGAVAIAVSNNRQT